jgi:hypothetical protein
VIPAISSMRLRLMHPVTAQTEPAEPVLSGDVVRPRHSESATFNKPTWQTQWGRDLLQKVSAELSPCGISALLFVSLALR